MQLALAGSFTPAGSGRAFAVTAVVLAALMLASSVLSMTRRRRLERIEL
jgi:hypothetical protein